VDGIPISKLVESEKEKLLQLEDELHRRVIGQNEQSVVADAIQRSGRLADPNRPTASFIFPVPALGNGTAKALLPIYLILKRRWTGYVRVHGEARRFKAYRCTAAWYVEGGQLSEAIRRRPYAVVLFDEIEKLTRCVQHHAANFDGRYRCSRSYGDFKTPLSL